MTVITAPAPATSGRLVAADGKTLPLRSSQLTTTAGNGLARTRLVQRFANPHREPLSVNYQLPLPADGAVAGFAFTVGDRRVEGEIEGRKAARERFEEAVAQGHTAALLEQDRTALFQQAIGNIPPGAEVVAEILVEQPLLWIDGVWEFRFPTTVAPRYLGAEGRVPDAARIEVDVAGAPLPPRLELELRVEDLLAPGSEVASPSHGLQGEFAGGTRTVRFAAGPVRLDRDLVVRWNVGTPEVGTSLATARPGAGAPHGDVAYGLLTLVPPAGPTVAVPRDLTVLIDTSGSMGGRPLDQAKAVVKELVAGLGDQDQLQMIEFSDAPRRWQPGPVRATAATRRKAQQWLAGLTASGGTEMLSGVRESLCSLREEAQAQVLLVTDGLVGFEQQIVSALRNGLPRNCRFHVLGVGSATNRSLSYAAARAGRGVEAIVCLDEDPAEGARRLGAAMRTPVVVDLELSGPALLGAAPERLPDLLAGSPARLSLRLCPEGGKLEVRGRTADGPFTAILDVPALAPGHGRPEIVTRCGREMVEDLETRVAEAGCSPGPRELEQQIETLGRQFRIATRFTSWIAVSSEPTVDPRAPIRRETIAQELPHGLAVEGLGLRSALRGPDVAWRPSMSMPAMSVAKEVQCREPDAPISAPRARGARGRLLFPFELAWLLMRRPGQPEATLVSLHDGRLVLEFDSDGRKWTLPAEVRLLWDDGTETVVQVDPALSTRSGRVAAGLRIRLVLALPQDAPAAPPIALRLRRDTLPIVPAAR